MRQEVYKLLLKAMGIFLLVLFQISLYAYLWFTYYVPLLVGLRRNFFFWGNWAVIGIYFLFLMFFIKNFDGFKSSFQRVKDTCISFGLAIVFTNLVSILQSWIVGRHYFSVLPVMLLTLVQMFVILAWSLIIRRIYWHISEPVKIAVIHGKCSPNAFQSFLDKSNLLDKRLYILSVLNIEEGEEETLDKMLAQKEIILYDLPSEKRNPLLKFCYENSKSVYITPKISDILVGGAEKLNLFDTPLLKVRRKGFSVETLVAKRLIDIVLATFGLVITSPFLLISALIIKAYDGGSVFFKQKRLTRNEKEFEIIKFRSMREDSEPDGPQIAKQKDSRITPYGKFLRSTHLDELPQLINILKGEMTFVGPRPERIENIKKYEEKIPEFKYRLAVKAGLTGYAQLYGKYDTTPYDKLKLDLEYIENHSLWLDLKLIILTFKVMFQKDNAEGVKKQQKTALLDEE